MRRLEIIFFASVSLCVIGVACGSDGDNGGNGGTAGTGGSKSDASTGGTNSGGGGTGAATTGGVGGTGGSAGGAAGSGPGGNAGAGGGAGQGPTACGKAIRISAGQQHACAIRDDGTLWCWGGNESAQIGDGSYANKPAPVQVADLGANVTTVAAGDNYTCATKSDHTLWCWGNNNWGAVGDGTQAGDKCGGYVCRPKPVQVTPFATSASDVFKATLHVCATQIDGTLWCWGNNSFGQVGDGTTDSQAAPTQVAPLAGIDASGGGDFHTCAKTSSGVVSCWGANGVGQLGNGATGAGSPGPVAVTGLPAAVSQLSIGSMHGCALGSDARVYCWGGNERAPLGQGVTSTAEPQALQVSALGDGVSAIAAGSHHSCAVKSDGTLWCWGWNTYGQIGDGTTQGIGCGPPVQNLSCRLSPVQVTALGSTVVEVAAGSGFTCARDDQGQVWCWGSSDKGALGDGAFGGQACYLTYKCNPNPVQIALPCP